jgi:hypothetical protein
MFNNIFDIFFISKNIFMRNIYFLISRLNKETFLSRLFTIDLFIELVDEALTLLSLFFFSFQLHINF